MNERPESTTPPQPVDSTDGARSSGAADPRPAPAPKPEPPPSPPPSRGPRLRIIAVVIVVSLITLWIGMTWGNNLKSGLSQVWAAIGVADRGDSDAADHAGSTTFYTCGMHPWVILPKPGLCPICQMDLTPIDPNKFTGEITIDPTITQSIGVRIAPVTTGPLVKKIRTVGTIDYDETTVRDINIKVPGWIEAMHVDYLGAEVAVGDPLFDFYSPELYAAQEEFLLAYRNKDRIGADFMPEAAEGAQDMVASSRTRLEYFDITPEQIEELIKTGTPAKSMTIHSPYRGAVIAKHANEGMRVDQGMQVYRIADLSKVWGMVTLYEYQLPYVQAGQRATMTLPYIPGQTFQGEVIYIYPYLDTATRQVNVRLEFDNPAGLLKPGMYVNVELENRLAAERVLAPRAAVIDTGERQIAFVSLGEGRFEPRDVRTGVETEDGMVEILDGLRDGENVVTSGQFLLDSEAKIREGLAKMIRGDLASEQEAIVRSTGQSELSALPKNLATAMQTLLTSYFAIGDTLAGDSILGIADHARRIAKGVDELLTMDVPEAPHFWHRHEEVATIRGKALELLSSSDIEAARLHFADLSVALSTLSRATGIPPTYDAQVQELHCPMYREGQGGSIWLQPAGSVRNPFYGSMMLECFDKRSVIPTTGTASQDRSETGPDASSAVPDENPTAAPAAPDVETQSSIDAAHGAYMVIHDRLTRNAIDGLDEQFRVIGTAAAALADAEDSRVQAVAGRLATTIGIWSGTLDSARTSFEELSLELADLWRVAPPSPSVAPVVYEVYCPMVKKTWLQTSRDVANPYAPDMLRCGSVKGVVAGTDREGESR